MSKITLTNLVNLENQTTAVNAINSNNAVLTTAFDNTLSRDGSTPNTMGSTLDMNSNRILNLPQASFPTDPVRLQEVGNAPVYATAAAASAASAATSASAASSSATTAQGYIVGLSGNSTTSVTIGTGSKNFTATTGKLWVAGQFVIVSSNVNSANYMHGSVTSYNSTTGALVVNVLDIGGSGTFTDWNITISGSQGTTGPSGPTTISGTPTVNQFTTFVNSSTIQGVSLTGLVKGNGASAPTAAVSGTDYIAPPSGTAILKANAGGALANAVAGTDYLAPAAIGTTVQAFDAQLTSIIPQNSQSAPYTLVLTDGEKHIFHPAADTTARTFTIPANASVAYPIGTAITFINQNSAGIVTIAITTDTMRLAGVGTTGSRTLAANGVATAIKVTSTEWIISGTGLT